MDEKAVKATVGLYDSHANVHKLQNQAERQSGEAYPLKQYHNEVKLQLIRQFATNAGSLLDLCCGRGGDIFKWIRCNVRSVLGLDISMKELVEAKKRLEAAKRKRGTNALEAQFKHVACLGTKEMNWDKKFDVVTCMFAIHYFFVNVTAAKMFFKNVAAAIKPGGHFIATFPSGKQVLAALNLKDEYRSPMLYLKKHWKGQPSVFGSPFTCAIADTVTSGGQTGEDISGSFEYLVFFNVIEGVAKEFNLELVTKYDNPDLDALFQDADAAKGFKHFKPPFQHREDGLKVASELYVACVFRMKSRDESEAAGEKRKRRDEDEAGDTTASGAAAPPEGKAARLENM